MNLPLDLCFNTSVMQALFKGILMGFTEYVHFLLLVSIVNVLQVLF